MQINVYKRRKCCNNLQPRAEGGAYRNSEETFVNFK